MNREIKPIKCTFGEPDEIIDPATAWKKNAESDEFRYLLAYADDGVIWGSVEPGKLLLSSAAYPDVSPELRPETLRELRLFGPQAEWFLWRTESGWRARLITEEKAGEAVDAFTESYILWGTDPLGQAQAPFTLVTEADTGIRHAPPLTFKGRHSMRLLARHYLGYDGQNAAYIKLSRLVGLENGGKQ